MKRRDVFEGLLAAPLVASEVAADQISNTEPAVSKLPMVNIMERPKGGEGREMPNVLWICVDQCRYDTIEGLNNPLIRTPNLKRLMVEGVAFTNYAVQYPICSPSLAPS